MNFLEETPMLAFARYGLFSVLPRIDCEALGIERSHLALLLLHAETSYRELRFDRQFEIDPLVIEDRELTIDLSNQIKKLITNIERNPYKFIKHILKDLEGCKTYEVVESIYIGNKIKDFECLQMFHLAMGYNHDFCFEPHLILEKEVMRDWLNSYLTAIAENDFFKAIRELIKYKINFPLGKERFQLNESDKLDGYGAYIRSDLMELYGLNEKQKKEIINMIQETRTKNLKTAQTKDSLITLRKIIRVSFDLEDVQEVPWT